VRNGPNIIIADSEENSCSPVDLPFLLTNLVHFSAGLPTIGWGICFDLLCSKTKISAYRTNIEIFQEIL
jgi:hypothetical protein